MQLAILLHLLHRRRLLPQQRTELYSEYLKTFLDREQSEDKEPLLAEERQVIEDIHAYIGWHIHTQTEEGTGSGSIRSADLKALVREHLADRDGGPQLAEKLLAAFTTRVLCLIERDEGTFQFEVQSLREYFAAVYIFEEADRSVRDECLAAVLTRPYWSNVCRFLVGMYSKGEVRGMRAILQDLSKDAMLGLHPMLRSTAALFLNDRTYEGQKEEPIQEIVDFILGGSGVVLAEDGLLDTAGSSLQLSERAGRTQAVRHLKARLEKESDPEIRAATASSLRRHVTADDDLAAWWWAQDHSVPGWLETASELGVLGELSPDAQAHLPQLLTAYESDSVWISQLLAVGGYEGTDVDVLNLVKQEANDGAIEVIRSADYATPMGQILTGAATAALRTTETTAGSAGQVATKKGRRKNNTSVLSDIQETTAELCGALSAPATDTDWQQRLLRVARTWGDGWVLSQAIAVVPPGISLSAMALLVQSKSPELHAALITEAARRENRKNADWWRHSLTDSRDGGARRQWIFSLLTSASTAVVVALTEKLNNVVDALAPKHYLAIRHAITVARNSPTAGIGLVLNDVLRLNQAQFSPRTLWLLRSAATESSLEPIDKRLASVFENLLAAGDGDLRELTRLTGQNKTIKFDTFRGHRASLPAGGWASHIKLGALRPNLAQQVLEHPHQWPSDLVQRAVEKVEDRILTGLPSIAQVADTEKWFDT